MGHSAAAMRDGTDRVLLLGGLRSQGTAEIVPGEDSQNVGENKRCHNPQSKFLCRWTLDPPSAFCFSILCNPSGGSAYCDWGRNSVSPICGQVAS